MDQKTRRDREYERLNPKLLRLVGHAATAWASLEYHINDLIWRLADTPPMLGACMTAQIFTIDGRLRALLALLKLRQASNKTVDAVNKFSENVRGPSEMRNRIVHDPWGIHVTDYYTAKVEITANKKLRFEQKRIELTEVKAQVDKIIDCVESFYTLRDQILVELPTLPEIHQLELHPIRSVPRPRT